MEPFVSTQPNERIESDRTECNSPLPQLPLPSDVSRDIESGMDPDDAFRKALQSASNDNSESKAAAEEGSSNIVQGVVINVQEKEIVVLEEPRDYFAMGEDQDVHCIAKCENSYEDRKQKKDRMIPCFSNSPLKCFRRPRIFTCFGNRFRVCSRAGNFTVLLERLIPSPSYSSIQPGDNDEENSSGSTSALSENDDELLRPHQPPRRDLWLVMGPYWPFCLVLTTNLIITIPTIIIIVLWHILPYREPLYAFMALVALTLFALTTVACRDPGLMPHIAEEPEESRLSPANVRPSKKWIFNDLTSSWRPRGAVYDRDVNAVIADFDHVCPFTGTAIGGNNIPCFYFFVTMVNILSCVGLVLGGLSFFLLAQNDFQWKKE